MGVKNLNKILNECEQEPYDKYHSVIIIDGSNLIFQVLSRQLSKLKKEGTVINRWNSFDAPLVKMMIYIIRESINDISNQLERYFNRGVKEIFIVTDPHQTPSYKINTTMEYNHKYEKLITGDDSLKNGETVELNIKFAEQNLRKERNNKEKYIDQEIGYIMGLKRKDESIENFDPNHFDCLTEEQVNILIDIFKQSYCFNDNGNLLRLGWIVLKTIDFKFREKGVRVVDAVDEADLVIKNIASEYSEDTNILVLSMDTDYNILFSDMPNVDVSTLIRNDVIRNPCKCWKQILGNIYSYGTVIRISPILGNDYTVGEPLIGANNYKDILCLYNVDDKFNELKRSARKKIYKVVYGVEKPEGILKNEEVDDIIYNWCAKDKNKENDYFKKYYLSNIIYENWKMYGRYRIIDSQDEFTIEEERETSFVKILATIDENYKNGITLYNWNSAFLFTDWKEFFNSVEKIELSESDFMVYYHTCDEMDIEEGAELMDEEEEGTTFMDEITI